MSTRPGAEKGGRNSLYTAGDLAASMALNPYLKVFVANGYYDAVTPFFQTVLDLEEMPLVTPQLRDNLTLSYYESGHMVYLDNASRARTKNELATFYDAGARPSSPAATASLRRGSQARELGTSSSRSTGGVLTGPRTDFKFAARRRTPPK